jgi:type II secretory pathway pseudopilin PulG
MKRETGFTIVEVLVATMIMLVILAATVGALTDAIHATQAVTLMADTQENLRAGMNYMVRDLMQAGGGMPQSGITIPANTVPWPGTAGKFPAAWTALPAIAPGGGLGPTTATSGVASDLITILYADNTLLDNTFAPAHWLNEFPINLAGSCPTGSITSAGAAPSLTITVKFDKAACVSIDTGNTRLSVGDLILLQNNAGGCRNGNSQVASSSCDSSGSNPTSSQALRTITGVNTATNSITFAPADPFSLNGAALPAGTMTATRIWMITYYIDNGKPARPQLMREVNLKGASPVGDVIENLQIFYDIVSTGTGTGPRPLASTQNETPTFAQLQYIRNAYILMFARSENLYTPTGKYIRNNLESVVSIRGLNFYNEFK